MGQVRMNEMKQQRDMRWRGDELSMNGERINKLRMDLTAEMTGCVVCGGSLTMIVRDAGYVERGISKRRGIVWVCHVRLGRSPEERARLFGEKRRQSTLHGHVPRNFPSRVV